MSTEKPTQSETPTDGTSPLQIEPASEVLFRRLVESVHDYAIFLLNSTGHIATWNAGAQRIKGYRATEIIGKHFSVFYPPEDVQAGKCEYELKIATLEGRFEDEGWRVRKDGTSFWANVIISAVRDDDGILIGFSKITRDLTIRKKAEEERAARLAAEQANKAKDEFLAMLGHELRNPLAPIITALQLMKLRSDQRTSKEQQVIERQVKHMIRLVDDLLDISRITRGKITLKKQSLDVRDIVAKAVEIASPLLEQRCQHFEVQAPQWEILIDADDARLTQVFANLLLNAAKYTESEGHVTVKIEEAENEVVVEVIDDGVGINADLLPRVFDLFVQGYQGPERSGGGLGIGLTLVRTLTEMHGGKVEAHSAGLGMGSMFRVRLPKASENSFEDSKRVAPKVFQRAKTTHSILLVDDNEDALLLLADVLSSVGHSVKTAHDAVEALEAIETFKPAIAILDIGLPVMDGYALASHLRAQLAPNSLRLIALTGYGQPNDYARSTEAGFNAHLVKPIDPQRLIDCIDEIN